MMVDMVLVSTHQYVIYNQQTNITNLFLELRSAIENNRQIIVVQDFHFVMPDELLPEAAALMAQLQKYPKFLYIAEFFSACISALRGKLGIVR